MACIRRKLETNAIKTRMYQWMMYILGTAIAINVITTGFHFVNLSEYKLLTEQTMKLNQFYTDLKSSNARLMNYVQTGAADSYKDLENMYQENRSVLQKLEDAKVSQEFTRDLQDVSCLFEVYWGRIQEINEKIGKRNTKDFTTSLLVEIYDIYERAQNVYELICNDYNMLQSSLVEYAGIKQQMVSRQIKIYYVEFAVVMILLIGNGIWNGRTLAEQIVKPIQKLTEKAVEIRDGNMKDCQVLNLETPANTETEILIQVFNMMLDRIKEQFNLSEENSRFKAELYKKEIDQMKLEGRLRNSELKALQMQMNPHFLFNTLNMISQTVYLGDPEKTIFLLQKTANLLRYSLDYMGKSVTLEHEIEMLDCYVCLQEQRFGERIEFNFDFDESFHQIKVPCLVLQPLVENSITHGLGMCTEKGEVLIRTRCLRDENKGYISVIDNGAGIPADKLSQIMHTVKSENVSSSMIGLSNVYLRLQNFYCGRADMELYSICGEKTEVRLILPLNEGEIENV
ncbi:MAG: histidine kinase [Lachnospiraceae bacterium]|nr:histidine kinase [Robinsoniella sp.]MDY3767881.1 histidine kinase [Lachnospiraceae bacterium]